MLITKKVAQQLHCLNEAVAQPVICRLINACPCLTKNHSAQAKYLRQPILLTDGTQKYVYCSYCLVSHAKLMKHCNKGKKSRPTTFMPSYAARIAEVV